MQLLRILFIVILPTIGLATPAEAIFRYGKASNAPPMIRYEFPSTRGNPPFYEVLGQRYFVKGTSKGYHDIGIASWYGPDFHGKTTSSGEIYNMYGMTAAHKELPIPCHVKVTNLENGKSIIVRVNDRGPFHTGRIIDLSYTAAHKLGITAKGTAKVAVAALPPFQHLSNTPIVKRVANQIYLQLGAFGQQTNAENFAHRLEALLHKPVNIWRSSRTWNSIYRVKVGPFKSLQEVEKTNLVLAAAGLNKGIIVSP